MTTAQFDDVNVTGTLSTTHVSAQGNISAVGNVNAGETVNTTHVSAQGNISARGNVNAGDTVNTTHLIAQGNISALGNVNAARFNTTGGDCAEEFEVDTNCAVPVAPGMVVVLGDEGCLRLSVSAYDKRVAGVVSGGGNYKPGIIFDYRGSNSDRTAIALSGKVFCNVDASYGSIEVGDLLTTSNTPGHAMKASDPSRAFGTIIGKALRPLHEGKDMVPILVALL